MGPGAKVGVLVVALGAAVAAVLALVNAGDDPPAAPETASSPAPPPAASPRAETVRAPRSRDTAAEAPPSDAAGIHLTGTVVDEEGAPVAGAVVRATRGGAAACETKSDAEGRFTIACGHPPATGSLAVGVSALAADGRAGFVAYDLMEDAKGDDDLGDIVVGRAIALTARVEDSSGPVAGARVFVGSFFGAVFASATTDAKGVARLDSTPAADAWLFAYAPGRGRARGEIPDGRDPKTPLVLTLTARTIRVSVVRAPDQTPLAGERITARLVTNADGSRLFSEFVPPLELPATGDTGIVTVDDVAAEDAVEFRRVQPETEHEAWRFSGLPQRPAIADAREIEARLEVPAGRTIRWRIVPGDAPPPAEGTLVSLERGLFGALPAAPPSLVVEGGYLVGAGFGDGEVRGIVRAPDGSMARLAFAGDDARFCRPRAAEVTVRDDAGQPVLGVGIRLRTAAQREIADEIRTGADGIATFRGIEPDLGVLDVSARTEAPADVRWVASVELSAGDAHVDVRLPRPQEIVLRVTIDGELRIPPGLRVLVDGAVRTDAVTEEPSDVHVLAFAPAAGAPARVVLRADGYLDCAADVACGPSRGPVVVDMALSSGVTLWAEFRPTPGANGLYATARVQRLQPGSSVWEDCRELNPLVAGRRESPSDARWRFDHAAPGRYRLFSAALAVGSDPVDVVAGRNDASLRLDLSRGGPVRVRVVGPDDTALPEAWVTLDEPDGDWLLPHMVGRQVNLARGVAGGSVVVPGDRPVRIVARHATLRPDPERGSVVLTEPVGDTVTLRLIEGPVIEFTTARSGRAPVAQSALLHLFRGAPTGPPDATIVAFSDGTRLRAGGVPPGRYTIWIALPGGAPAILPGVEVRDGVNDLGEIRPRPGCAVRVRIAVPPGQAAPWITVTVTRLDAPEYASSAASQGADEVTVAGLGPGRFEVAVSKPGSPDPRGFVRTVELDGEHDVVVDYAPR